MGPEWLANIVSHRKVFTSLIDTNKMTEFTPSNKKLQGKVAIIIGGASGMGEATTHHFAVHGARAIVIADIQDEKGQTIALSIGSNICTYVHCDVTDEEQVKTLVDTTVKAYGRLDIMFGNTGMGRATSRACWTWTFRLTTRSWL